MKLVLVHDYTLPTGVLGLALSPSAKRCFVACIDGFAYSVDLENGKFEPFAEKHDSFASSCLLLPDNRTVITGGYDGVIRWHDLESGQCFRKVQAHKFWSWQTALSTDGTQLVSTTGQYLPGSWKYEPANETEPSIKLYNPVTGNELAKLQHVPPVLSCAFSNDGSYLAAANMLGEIRIWNIRPQINTEAIARWTSPDFTSWGSIKTHHYCGGIYSLAFSPDDSYLLGCGMGPMADPMAGNGKMTWQRWDWRKGEKRDQIKEGQHGAGLMESLAWHPGKKHFLMAGKQAQGTYNAALFSAEDGSLVHSIDTKKRITTAKFSANGELLLIAGALGQPSRKDNKWASWGKIQLYRVES